MKQFCQTLLDHYVVNNKPIDESKALVVFGLYETWAIRSCQADKNFQKNADFLAKTTYKNLRSRKMVLNKLKEPANLTFQDLILASLTLDRIDEELQKSFFNIHKTKASTILKKSFNYFKK